MEKPELDFAQLCSRPIHEMIIDQGFENRIQEVLFAIQNIFVEQSEQHMGQILQDGENGCFMSNFF